VPPGNIDDLISALASKDNSQGNLGIEMVHEDQPLNHGDIPSELYQLEQLATRFELPTNSLLKNQGGTMCLDSTEEVLQSLGFQNLDFPAKEEINHTMCILQENRHKLAPHLGSLDQENSNFASLKRCVMTLTVFTLLLTLSNFCISMVATQVSNDLTGSSGRWGSVSHDNGNVRASTTPKHIVVHMNPIEKETSTRHLKEVEEAACHQETYTADYAGTDWETAGSNGTTVFCEAVGSVDYDDATRLYQAFCPQYPDITDASACANIGLSEVVLQCGASLTRILGGAYFPIAGTPGWDESETVRPIGSKVLDRENSLRWTTGVLTVRSFHYRVLFFQHRRNSWTIQEVSTFTAFSSLLNQAPMQTHYS
jgi:hypothetical protein